MKIVKSSMGILLFCACVFLFAGSSLGREAKINLSPITSRPHLSTNVRGEVSDGNVNINYGGMLPGDQVQNTPYWVGSPEVDSALVITQLASVISDPTGIVESIVHHLPLGGSIFIQDPAVRLAEHTVKIKIPENTPPGQYTAIVKTLYDDGFPGGTFMQWTYTVTVVALNVELPTALQLNANDTKEVTATITPTGASIASITWEPLQSDILEVLPIAGTTKATLKAKKTGSVTLKVTVKDSAGNTATDTCAVTVESAEIKMDILGGLIKKAFSDGYSHEWKNRKDINEKFLCNIDPTLIQYKRGGFTADGNSRLFIRCQSSTPDTLYLREKNSYTGLVLENLTRSSSSDQYLELPLQPVDGSPNVFQATFVITAPESWSDGEKLIRLELCSVADKSKYRSFDIVVRPTPVLLIHGLWATAEASFPQFDPSSLWGYLGYYWKPIIPGGGYSPLARGKERFNVSAFGYENFRGPSEVMMSSSDGLYLKVKDLLKRENKKGIESTRVDIVAHSMGGLMARKFMHDNKYYVADYNYGLGAVRRFIAIATPHFGSGLASYLRRDTKYLKLKDLDDESSDAFVNWRDTMRNLKWAGKEVDSAITDLAINSELLQELNTLNTVNRLPQVPTFVIVGDINRKLLFKWLPLWLSEGHRGIAPYTHEDLFNNIPRLLFNTASQQPQDFIPENSDGVVGVSSAQWLGYLHNAKEGVGMSTVDHQHTGMGADAAISHRVLQLLEADKSVFIVPQPSYLTPRGQMQKQINGRRVNSTIDLSPIPENKFTIRANKNSALPGEELTFFADIPTDLGEPIYVSLFEEDAGFIPMEKISSYHYQGSIKLNGYFSGVKSFKAVTKTTIESFGSNAVDVIVKPDTNKLSSLSFAHSEITVGKGRTYKVHPIGFFSDHSYYDLAHSAMGTTYNILDTSIAHISKDGVLHALNEGQTTLTATNGLHKATLNIVVEIPTINTLDIDVADPTSIRFVNGTPTNLTLGKTISLAVEVLPSNTNTTFNWVSGDDTIVAFENIEDGYVTLKGEKEGVTTVTVTTSNGLSATHKITVLSAVTSSDTPPSDGKNGSNGGCGTGIGAGIISMLAVLAIKRRF